MKTCIRAGSILTVAGVLSLAVATVLAAGSTNAGDVIPRAGLELWFKADGDLKLNGQTVVQWNDLSGQDNHAMREAGKAASPGNPLLVRNAFNGKPVVRFDGTDTGFAFRRIADMRTVFWVVSKDPAAFGQRNERFVFGDTGFGLLYNTDFHPGSHTKSFLLHDNTGSAFLREGQVRLNGRLVDGQTTDFPTTLGVVSFVTSGNVTASHLSYDRGYSGRSWQGDLAEVIVYNRVLSDGERAGVEQYLFDKYGIPGRSEPAPPSEAWAAAAAAGTTRVWSTDAPRPETVAALAFDPAGTNLAVAAETVRIFEVRTGKRIRTLDGNTGWEAHPPVRAQPGQFTRVAYSPGGEWIAACGTDLAMHLWKSTTNTAVPLHNDLTNKGVALWGFAFSPDGKSLVVNNRERAHDVKRYDLATGKTNAFLNAPANGWQGRLWWIAYSPDGRRIASSSENKTLRVWDAATGALINTLETGSVVWQFAFSPDGRTLAAACVNMTLQLWDVETGKLRQTLSGHGAGLTAVAYSPDGKTIATGSDDATIRLWEASTGKALGALTGHTGCVWSVAFSPDGKLLASGGQDDTVKFWDYHKKKLLRTIVVDPANYDESKVGTYTLPDPLLLRNGAPVRDSGTWLARRRAEILDLYRERIYGRSPKPLTNMTFDVWDVDRHALDGGAVRKQIEVNFSGKGLGPLMHILMYTPADAKGPVPLFLCLQFAGNYRVIDDPAIAVFPAWDRKRNTLQMPKKIKRGDSARNWRIEDILARGYGIAVMDYNEIEPDLADGSGIKYGVRSLFLKSGRAKPAADEWGAIGAWAWGLSRAMDYVETDKDVDPRRVIALGQSRLGKTVLWAGAQDERFAMVIASCSGEMGAALARRNYGETVTSMSGSFAYQFCRNFLSYSNRIARMPVDSHLLVSLIAPRPLYLSTGSEDRWSDPNGEFLAARAAEPVYHLFGEKGLETDQMPPLDVPIMHDLGFQTHTGKHDILAADWDRFLDFADLHFQGKTPRQYSGALTK